MQSKKLMTKELRKMNNAFVPLNHPHIFVFLMEIRNCADCIHKINTFAIKIFD